MIRPLLLFLLFSCCLSFGQKITFVHETIGLDLKLDLNEDQTFVLTDAGRGCEGNEFAMLTYKGTYILANNLLELEPETIFAVRGKIIYENRVKIEKIESSTLEDFDPKNSLISLKYELLDFEDFKLLLKLDYPTYSDEYVISGDHSIFFNYLNSTKEVNKKYNDSFKSLFLTAEEENIDVSLEKMRQSEALRNRKEIFTKPFIATIKSIKKRIDKNEHYYPDFDDRKFITYLDIEIDAGINDGVYNGMHIHFKNISDCIPDEYTMTIEQIDESTSTFAYALSINEECELIDYLVNQQVYFKGFLSP